MQEVLPDVLRGTQSKTCSLDLKGTSTVEDINIISASYMLGPSDALMSGLI